MRSPSYSQGYLYVQNTPKGCFRREVSQSDEPKIVYLQGKLINFILPGDKYNIFKILPSDKSFFLAFCHEVASLHSSLLFREVEKEKICGLQALNFCYRRHLGSFGGDLCEFNCISSTGFRKIGQCFLTVIFFYNK